MPRVAQALPPPQALKRWKPKNDPLGKDRKASILAQADNNFD
jgi:hypothetical protein